jgi:hypothetical protein
MGTVISLPLESGHFLAGLNCPCEENSPSGVQCPGLAFRAPILLEERTLGAPLRCLGRATCWLFVLGFELLNRAGECDQVPGHVFLLNLAHFFDGSNYGRMKSQEIRHRRFPQ